MPQICDLGFTDSCFCSLQTCKSEGFFNNDSKYNLAIQNYIYRFTLCCERDLFFFQHTNRNFQAAIHNTKPLSAVAERVWMRAEDDKKKHKDVKSVASWNLGTKGTIFYTKRDCISKSQNDLF